MTLPMSTQTQRSLRGVSVDMPHRAGIPVNVYTPQIPRPHTDSPGMLDPEVAGDFYLIIIMVILMIIIILHHGADDYNRMGMQGALHLGLHDGGY